MRKGFAKDLAKEAGGDLCISGSYRLGVNSTDADIDVICVTPNICELNDFFGPDEDELANNAAAIDRGELTAEPPYQMDSYLYHILKNDPLVSEIYAIKEAFVPIINLKFNRVEMDLQFCRLPVSKASVY